MRSPQRCGLFGFGVKEKMIVSKFADMNRIFIYYLSHSDFEDIINNKKKFLKPSLNSTYIDIVDNSNVNILSGYFGRNGKPHTENGIANYDYYTDRKNNKAGVFTTDGTTFYEIADYRFTSEGYVQIILNKINGKENNISVKMKDEINNVKKKRITVPYKTKALLLKEVDNRCPFCNSEEVSHLQPHHIDGNPSNNEPLNLLMVCPTCHSKIEKRDIHLSKVKETKTNLSKTKTELSVLEIAELEHEKFERERLKYEYLHSQKAKDDILKEGATLFTILKSKCEDINNKFKSINIEPHDTSRGHLQICMDYIYILVQLYPQTPEYQLSCTFNEGWAACWDESKRSLSFIVYKYKYDMDDLRNLGWNKNGKFYTSEKLADSLLKELMEVNKSYKNRFDNN